VLVKVREVGVEEISCAKAGNVRTARARKQLVARERKLHIDALIFPVS